MNAPQEPMMAETIAFVLRNLPVFLFVAALVFAWLGRSGASMADRLLAWILLLPIGVSGIWAAVFIFSSLKSPRRISGGSQAPSSSRWPRRISRWA
jgi:hypothetical protein